MTAVRHLLLDRDGVLNVEHPDRITTTRAAWEWIPGSREALVRAHQAGVRVSIVTNQSAIGRGQTTLDEVEALHAAVAAEVVAEGGKIAAFYVCPHAPEEGCACRKPRPASAHAAMAACDIPPEQTLFVGDMGRDLECGLAAGVRSALVRTGKGRQTEPAWAGQPVLVFDDLRALVAAMCEVTSAIRTRIARHFDELVALASASRDALTPNLERAAQLCIEAIARGNKLMVCGNGGSAADAQHFAAELVGRFQKQRRGLPAIALTTDTSILTSVANDSGYEQIFARQVEALARPGDVLLAISTSGTSKNVVAAARMARELGCSVITWTGQSPGPLGDAAEVSIVVPSAVVARIQEVHELALHALTDAIEAHFTATPP